MIQKAIRTRKSKKDRRGLAVNFALVISFWVVRPEMPVDSSNPKLCGLHWSTGRRKNRMRGLVTNGDGLNQKNGSDRANQSINVSTFPNQRAYWRHFGETNNKIGAPRKKLNPGNQFPIWILYSSMHSVFDWSAKTCSGRSSFSS